MRDIIWRNINGQKIGIDPNYPRRIAFETLPNDLSTTATIESICRYLSMGYDHTPLAVKFEITSRCTLNCSFCYIHNHMEPKDISYDKLHEYINYFLKKGLIYATLTGGECLMHPDFIEIYRYLKLNGVIVDVYTNGTLISNQVLNIFQKLPPNKVEISLYHTFDEFPKPYQALKELKKRHIDVLAKLTIAKETEYLFEHIDSWCVNHDIPLQVDSDLFDFRDGQSVDNHLSQMNVIPSLKQKTPIKEGRIPVMFNCAAGFCSLMVDCEGSLGICLRSPIRFKGENVDDSYQLLKAFVQQYRGRPFKEKCYSCPNAHSCRICFARCFHEADSNIVIVPEKYCKS